MLKNGGRTVSDGWDIVLTFKQRCIIGFWNGVGIGIPIGVATVIWALIFRFGGS